MIVEMEMGLEVILYRYEKGIPFYFNRVQTLENFLENHRYHFGIGKDKIGDRIVGWTDGFKKEEIVRNSKKSFEKILDKMELLW